MIPTIAYIRETYALTDVEVAAYVAAQQIQVSRDFAPYWNLDAVCVQVLPGQPIPDGAWRVHLIDHSPQADDLGYHDDTGIPQAYVAVKDDLADGVAWSVTASHETLEMLGDPEINQTVTVGTTEYAREVCDAPEDDRFSYVINGIRMSAFVLPAWFAPGGVAPFTFPIVPTIAAPFQLAEGGYIGVRVDGGQWNQRNAEGAPGRRAVRQMAHSRRARRGIEYIGPVSEYTGE